MFQCSDSEIEILTVDQPKKKNWALGWPLLRRKIRYTDRPTLQCIKIGEVLPNSLYKGYGDYYIIKVDDLMVVDTDKEAVKMHLIQMKKRLDAKQSFTLTLVSSTGALLSMFNESAMQNQNFVGTKASSSNDTAGEEFLINRRPPAPPAPPVEHRQAEKNGGNDVVLVQDELFANNSVHDDAQESAKRSRNEISQDNVNDDAQQEPDQKKMRYLAKIQRYAKAAGVDLSLMHSSDC